MHLNIILLTNLITVSAIIPTIAEIKEPFKINKLNLVWTKAHNTLGSSKLKDLKTDLLRHEADELSLKKLKAHNQDKDGLVEAAVRRKLLTIMTKYALDRYYDDIHQGVQKKTGEGNSKPQPIEMMDFRDSKLDKLWKKAEKSGFSQEQLMILHEEFENHQTKLDEHFEKMDAISDQSDRQKENMVDNSLESDIENFNKKRKNLETPSEKKARLESNLHQGLREKYHDLKEGIKDLHKKISTGEIASDGPFEEVAVNNLWSTALTLNFSKQNLESLKEKLEHFQTRIKKLKHFELELDKNEVGTKQSKSNFEDDDEIKHLKRRVKDLSKKVEETQRSIEIMFEKQRDEL